MYTPLHQKYRPQTFAQLVGQDTIAKALSNALKQNRIAPAYLFCGSRGTGKTSSARIFAKSLNCLSAEMPTDCPCGECANCKEIANGISIDVVEVDAASTSGVEKIREIIERAQFAPVSSRYKVYILDEVHSLSGAAFNALLKTLEEPPQTSVFILATTDPQRVLPTILSRCQRYNFQRIEAGAIAAHLDKIAHIEGIKIDPQGLLLVAKLAQGGLRDAQSLLDQLSLIGGLITTEQVDMLVGAIPEQALFNLLDAIMQNKGVDAIVHLRNLIQSGKDAYRILQELAGIVRDAKIAIAYSHRSGISSVSPETWGKLCEAAYSLAKIGQVRDALQQAEPQIRSSGNPVLWFELMIQTITSSAQTDSTNPDVQPLTLPMSLWEKALAELKR